MTGKAELEPYLVLGQELFRRVYAEDSAEEIHSWLATQLGRLAGSGDESARMGWLESFDFYEALMEKRAALAALPESERKTPTWPWATWRKLIDPMDPGVLAVISAADGGGKTLYAECIAEHWARRGLQVVYIHFELNPDLMLDRRTVRHTGIPRRTLKEGVLTGQDHARRVRSNDAMRAWPGGITYVHTPDWTMDKVVREVDALHSEKLCDVFVVDYLEKANASSRQLKEFGSNHYKREANDVNIVKQFAEARKVPALLLAQLNKSGAGAGFEDLDRHKITGAGEKSQRANIVVLLHRDNSESLVVKVRVDKNTMGTPGSFEQALDFAHFNVADMEPDEAPAPKQGRWEG